MIDCEFCNKPLHLSHYENNKEIAVYDCTNCPVLTSFYYFDKDGAPAKTCFLIDKNEKSYMWTNNHINGDSYIQELKVTSAPGFNPTILKFPKIMNVNPSNVYEKFAFYMVFL